jgi:hypothetical protein
MSDMMSNETSNAYRYDEDLDLCLTLCSLQVLVLYWRPCIRAFRLLQQAPEMKRKLAGMPVTK